MKILFIGFTVLGLAFAGITLAAPQDGIPQENVITGVEVIDLSYFQPEESPLASPEVEPIYEEPKQQVSGGTSVQLSSSRSCEAKGDCPLSEYDMQRIVNAIRQLNETLQNLLLLL